VHQTLLENENEALIRVKCSKTGKKHCARFVFYKNISKETQKIIGTIIREIKIINRLNHPKLAKVHKIFDEEEKLIIIFTEDCRSTLEGYLTK